MSENKQLRYDRAYLRIAREWGKLSHCERKKVGAIIVKDRMIISDGYNGAHQVLIIVAKMKREPQNGMYYMLKQMQY